MSMSVPYHTAQEVANRLCVKVDGVLGFIASGELVAVNVARSRSGLKPRWRISEEAVQDFLRSRTTSPMAKPVPGRRSRTDSSTIEFF